MTPLRIIGCNLFAVLTGFAAFAVVAAVLWPSTLRDPIGAIAVATLMYFSGPLVIASGLAVWRRRAEPLYLHLLLSFGWWLFLVYPWARKPWVYTGAFPWQGVIQMWLPILPAIVLAGVGFWVASPRVREDAV